MMERLRDRYRSWKYKRECARCKVTVFVVLDHDRVSMSTAESLTRSLVSRGLMPIILMINRGTDKPVEIFDLSHLPPADLKLVEALVAEHITARMVA